MLTLNRPADAKKHIKEKLGFSLLFALNIYVKYLVETSLKERKGCRCNG
jgi:hypothetical protein